MGTARYHRKQAAARRAHHHNAGAFAAGWRGVLASSGTRAAIRWGILGAIVLWGGIKIWRDLCGIGRVWRIFKILDHCAGGLGRL